MDDNIHLFTHPFVQTLIMFLGEILCLITYYLSINLEKVDRNENRLKKSIGGVCDENISESVEKVEKEVQTLESPFILMVPALLDLLASTLSNIGFLLTFASVYQILRGSGVIFTSILSYLCLGRRFNGNQIIGLIIVTLGLVVVGIASILGERNHLQAPSPALGNILIIFAQLFQSIQVIVEEYLLRQYNIHPLWVVGWEGIFGFIVIAALLVPFYWIPGWTYGNKLENFPDAIIQIGNSWIIGGAAGLIIVSIAFLNYFGIILVKKSGATARIVADATRILLVWAFALAVKWESFFYLQPVGLALILFGFIAFYRIISFPCFDTKEIHQDEIQYHENAPLVKNSEYERDEKLSRRASR